MNFAVMLDKLKEDIGSDDKDYHVNQVSVNDIAIIGLDAKIGAANNADELWQVICNGCDLIRDFPNIRRKDIEDYRKTILRSNNNQFPKKAYLERIDMFDASLFKIPPTEAEMMHPAQRMFLESVWNTLEDAGYGGRKLEGSRTGVYVGYHSSSVDYLDLIEATHMENNDVLGMALAGNVDSIIASRISYLLDFKGPAVMIDTACSSSLVAIHIACQALKNKEVDNALVGGIKIYLVPENSQEGNIGIASSSGRTKSFDDTADGTGGGEGVISVLLKPLYKALEDKDHIYAVIKGSCINQDGTSVGITAPNSAAQEEVIVNAWKEAGIHPETISYIEAHGTGTKLGDPIEINGLERAFRKYTNKKQFCAIGSIKSNAGHLDCAAGIAGFVKTVLMLQNGVIPPSVHFTIPNRQINFIESPIYVNDCMQAWEAGAEPLRCGVSSFGISGTNCHIVLEQAPKVEKVRQEKELNKAHILTLSAKRPEGLSELIQEYKALLLSNPTLELSDVCYVANTGRGHYNYRIAVVFENREQFLNLEIGLESNIEIGTYYGDFKIVDDEVVTEKKGYITETIKKELSQTAMEQLGQAVKTETVKEYQAILKYIAELYVKGADIQWEELYKKEKRYKVQLPHYPLNRKPCWIKKQPTAIRKMPYAIKEIRHPLLDDCVLDSMNLKVYSTRIGVDTCWELREHVIDGNHVLPGTVYVEMIREVGAKILETENLKLKDILFLVPMVCKKEDIYIVHTIVKIEKQHLDISICSQKIGETEWVCHAEGSVSYANNDQQENVELEGLINKFGKPLDLDLSPQDYNVVKVGKRWNNTKKVYRSNSEILAYLELPEKFEKERREYHLYPSLLDGAVNVANITTDGLCLPLSYETARFYKQIPRCFYSYLTKNELEVNSKELNSFDITLLAMNGDVIAKINNYVLKKVSNIELLSVNKDNKNGMFYDVEWIEKGKNKFTYKPVKEDVFLVIRTKDQKDEDIIQKLKERSSSNFIEVVVSDHSEKISASEYHIGCSQEAYYEFLESIDYKRIKAVLNMVAYKDEKIVDYQELEAAVKYSMEHLLFLFKAMLQIKIISDIQLVLLTKNASYVTERDTIVSPNNRAFIGMASCIELECSNIKTRAIDCDNTTGTDEIVNEIFSSETTYLTAYRKNKKYVEKLKEVALEENSSQEEMQIHDEGAYVIAGGMGGIGFAIGQYFASINHNVKLVLINRSTTQSEKLQELKNEGVTVEVIKADISDYEQMKQVIMQIRTKYKKINGIVHAAGVAGDGFLINKNWKMFKSTIQSKIFGTWVLHELTKEDEMDFLVLCSSLTSVLGAAGQSDYIAANSYMDSFTYYRNLQGKYTVTINWTGWNDIGMAVKHNVNTKNGLMTFINTQEGIAAFDLIMRSKASRRLVGEFNYQLLKEEKEIINNRILLSDKLVERLDKLPTKSELSDDVMLADIIVSGKSNDELSDIEKQVAYIWANMLGLSEIDIYDKFFEIGGNSLLASYLQKDLNKHFPGMIAITDIFVYSSVIEMAEYIEGKMKSEEASIQSFENIGMLEDIEDLVGKLANGEIAITDIEKFLDEA